MSKLITLIKSKIENLEAEVAEHRKWYGEDWEEFDIYDCSGGNFDDAYELGQEHGATYAELTVLRELLAEAEKADAELSEVKSELSESNDLLSDAHNLLDDIHGYDTDTYRAISAYFYGEEDE